LYQIVTAFFCDANMNFFFIRWSHLVAWDY